VTEGADPAGFTFESLACTGDSTSTSGKTATINLAPGDAVVCTYVNQQNTNGGRSGAGGVAAVLVPGRPDGAPGRGTWGHVTVACREPGSRPVWYDPPH
jgi:hypothetical protein